jgi:hypothetical protein
VSTEFSVCEETARNTLEELADQENLRRCKPDWQSYLISSDYWNIIDYQPEPSELLPDGGTSTTGSHSSSATTPIKQGTVDETDTAQDHSDQRDDQPLVDSPDSELLAPVAASVALLALGVANASLVPTSGLPLTVSWLAYQIAELPNYPPRDTVKELTTEQRVFSLL